MENNSDSPDCAPSGKRILRFLKKINERHPSSFTFTRSIAAEQELAPADTAVLLETELQYRNGKMSEFSPDETRNKGLIQLTYHILPSVDEGLKKKHEIHQLSGDWANKLTEIDTMNGIAGKALRYAIAVQEHNADMGLVAAFPTCGAAGVCPAVLKAVSEALLLPNEIQVGAFFVAGLIGKVAVGRGNISGAQCGCGGEIGVAAAMAAAAAAVLFGGNWPEVEAAASLATTCFTGLECSPAFGLVEYPCIPRNGFAAATAVSAAECAMAGIRTPYSLDYHLDVLFRVGSLLHGTLKETESSHWASSAQKIAQSACTGCPTAGGVCHEGNHSI